MKQFNNVKSGQVLIFIFFFLLTLGVLAGSLAVMWQSQVRTLSSEKEGLIALYLAQAGIERAKIEVLSTNGMNLIGAGRCPDVGSSPPCPVSTDPNGYPDLDPDTTDNYFSYYYFQIVWDPLGVPNRILITGRGEVRDANNVVIGCREIEVKVDGIEDADGLPTGLSTDPPDGTDDDGSGTIADWSWREI